MRPNRWLVRRTRIANSKLGRSSAKSCSPSTSVVRRVIGGILIVEAAIAGLATLQAIPALAGYDPIAIVLILAGAAIGALQLISGVQLLEQRASGPTLATTALALSAIVTTMVVGFRLAPSDVYYWYRWQFVAGYWIYAGAAIWYLRR